MKTGRFHILRVILTIYGLLYALVLISHFYSENHFNFDVQTSVRTLSTVVFAFMFYMLGAVYSWFNRKIGGILLMGWHFLVWVFALLLWEDAGIILVVAFPMSVFSVFRGLFSSFLMSVFFLFSMFSSFFMSVFFFFQCFFSSFSMF